jgi:hypothetical protein
MTPLTVFLDCEFTDFIDIDLVSIALVCEDGREFYAERSDFRREACSEFVRLAVLPHLGQIPEAGMTREELAVKLRAWIAELPEVVIASDSNHDRDLFCDAIDYTQTPNVVGWMGLDGFSDVAAEAFYHASVGYHDQPGHPWHHALHDARAHLAGWNASRQQLS